MTPWSADSVVGLRRQRSEGAADGQLLRDLHWAAELSAYGEPSPPRQPCIRFAAIPCPTCRVEREAVAKEQAAGTFVATRSRPGAKNNLRPLGARPAGCTCRTVWKAGEGPEAARERQGWGETRPSTPQDAGPPV